MKSTVSRWTSFSVVFALIGGAAGLGAADGKPLFPDENLAAAVRQLVFEKRDNNEPLVEADVVNLSTIKAVGKGIVDLTGLEKCRSLASLDLSRNKISQLDSLADLRRLQFLDLSKNEIVDIAPLSKVMALQYIELSNNKVKDLAPLSGLTNLASLYLSHNQIEDIGAVLKLPKLHSLYLADNNLKSIKGIGGIRWLSSLSLKDNAISDIEPLDGLTELYFLFLENNKIKDISVLLEMARRDFEGEKRFAPFVNIFLTGNPLTDKAKEQAKEMKEKFGCRMHP